MVRVFMGPPAGGQMQGWGTHKVAAAGLPQRTHASRPQEVGVNVMLSTTSTIRSDAAGVQPSQ